MRAGFCHPSSTSLCCVRPFHNVFANEIKPKVGKIAVGVHLGYGFFFFLCFPALGLLTQRPWSSLAMTLTHSHAHFFLKTNKIPNPWELFMTSPVSMRMEVWMPSMQTNRTSWILCLWAVKSKDMDIQKGVSRIFSSYFQLSQASWGWVCCMHFSNKVS